VWVRIAVIIVGIFVSRLPFKVRLPKLTVEPVTVSLPRRLSHSAEEVWADNQSAVTHRAHHKEPAVRTELPWR
jgi:hypothetical protein